MICRRSPITVLTVGTTLSHAQRGQRSHSSGGRFLKAPQTSVWAAVVASADEVGGRYCENCHVGQVMPNHITLDLD